MPKLDTHHCKESLLSDSDIEVEHGHNDLERYRVRVRPAGTWWTWLWISSLVAVALVTRSYYAHPSWNTRLAMADTYSPLYRDFHHLAIEKVLIGDELWDNGSNIFRQDPSPDVDEAWERLSHPKYMLVSKKELIKMSKPIEPVVRWPDEPDKLLMSLHAPHVMHCLDVLRKSAHHNFPHYYKDEALNAIHWTHWSHCLEILRQELTCRPSMHLNSMIWQEGQSNPFPDFHVSQRCVRWDDFDEMTSSRMIPDEDMLYVTMHPHKAKDADERLTPPEGWEVINKNREWIRKMTEEGRAIKDDH